jgi:hypothetical protein
MNSHQNLTPPLNAAADAWIARLFDAKTAARGGVVRRSVESVDREIGRSAFVQEVTKRGFHILECGGQFIVICNTGHLKIIA